jgi:hypothetical protein
VIGPNLDDLAPDYGTVRRQVTDGGNGMPSFRSKLSGRAIQAVATFVSDAARRDPRVSIRFVPTRLAPSRCGQHDFVCLRQAFGNIAYFIGPGVALRRLDNAQRSSAFIGEFCHQIAHEIGHAAYAREQGNTARALSEGAMTCGSGYYHGVVERAFAGLPRDRGAAVAQRLCTGVPASTGRFVLYQCVHGLGHGLMIYSGDDLPYSLRICNSLSSRWDQQSCAGGVFMQNFATGAVAMVTTRWLRSADLLYPCDGVAEQDKLYCYLQVTSRILRAVGYKWRRAAGWCARAERNWVATCMQSLGRDASGFERRRPRPILAICALAAKFAGECVYGAARDIVDNDARPNRASEMCAIAPGPLRSRCYEGVGSILGALHNDPSVRRAACDAAIRSDYRRRACYRGAGL